MPQKVTALAGRSSSGGRPEASAGTAPGGGMTAHVCTLIPKPTDSLPYTLALCMTTHFLTFSIDNSNGYHSLDVMPLHGFLFIPTAQPGLRVQFLQMNRLVK